MNNYEPPQKAYNASKANSFFMTILLLSFIATSAVIGYMIGKWVSHGAASFFLTHRHTHSHTESLLKTTLECLH